MTLLSLPPEIIVQVFVALLFSDLNVVVRVSRALRDVLHANAATIVRGRRDSLLTRVYQDGELRSTLSDEALSSSRLNVAAEIMRLESLALRQPKRATDRA